MSHFHRLLREGESSHLSVKFNSFVSLLERVPHCFVSVWSSEWLAVRSSERLAITKTTYLPSEQASKQASAKGRPGWRASRRSSGRLRIVSRLSSLSHSLLTATAAAAAAASSRQRRSRRLFRGKNTTHIPPCSTSGGRLPLSHLCSAKSVCYKLFSSCNAPVLSMRTASGPLTSGHRARHDFEKKNSREILNRFLHKPSYRSLSRGTGK